MKSLQTYHVSTKLNIDAMKHEIENNKLKIDCGEDYLEKQLDRSKNTSPVPGKKPGSLGYGLYSFLDLVTEKNIVEEKEIKNEKKLLKKIIKAFAGRRHKPQSLCEILELDLELDEKNILNLTDELGSDFRTLVNYLEVITKKVDEHAKIFHADDKYQLVWDGIALELYISFFEETYDARIDCLERGTYTPLSNAFDSTNRHISNAVEVLIRNPKIIKNCNIIGVSDIV